MSDKAKGKRRMIDVMAEAEAAETAAAPPDVLPPDAIIALAESVGVCKRLRMRAHIRKEEAYGELLESIIM